MSHPAPISTHHEPIHTEGAAILLLFYLFLLQWYFVIWMSVTTKTLFVHCFSLSNVNSAKKCFAVLFLKSAYLNIYLVLLCCSLFTVCKGSICHHWCVRQEDGEHADVILWCVARLFCDTQLPHWDLQPICDSTAAGVAGRLGWCHWILQVDQLCLHVQLRFRWVCRWNQWCSRQFFF